MVNSWPQPLTRKTIFGHVGHRFGPRSVTRPGQNRWSCRAHWAKQHNSLQKSDGPKPLNSQRHRLKPAGHLQKQNVQIAPNAPSLEDAGNRRSGISVFLVSELVQDVMKSREAPCTKTRAGHPTCQGMHKILLATSGLIFSQTANIDKKRPSNSY